MSAPASDFVREMVREDMEAGTFGGRVQTRFPPEPNGYLHIGHAKAIILDFGIASEFGGTCNLRFDDTNPDTEERHFVDGIVEDIDWLGYTPARTVHASDYFEQLYLWAEHLVECGLAYVDDQDPETISAQRGGYGRPGIESPYRDRTAEENLDLLRRMRAGEFPDGSRVLRARIDMAHENMQLRDPIMYRIRRGHHYRTADEWCIYPTYDWAHGQSDAIEGVTHSFCTLEFDSHRPLYDWFLERLPLPSDKPRQTEFARLELTHTVMSKRRLAELVATGRVDGWDDPRLPTLRGLRRRGYPAAAIRDFCTFIGVSRTNSRHEIELLESFVRTELNRTAQRRMAVLRPLRLVLTNWPTDEAGEPAVEWFELGNNPEDPADGTRQVPFSGELYIEREDFMEEPPRKYNRLGPGREVRLRNAYIIKYESMVKDEKTGEVTEIHCSCDPATRSAPPADGRKVQGVIHWVSAAHAVPAEVRLYDRLFTIEDPGGEEEFLKYLNSNSLETLSACYAEASLKNARPGAKYQFERLGYFCADPDSAAGRPVFNRVVPLRDSWAKIAGGLKKA